MQNPLFQPLKDERKLLPIEHEGLGHILKQASQNWERGLRPSSHSRIIKKGNGKSAMNRIAYKENVQATVTQNVKREQLKIHEKKDVMMEAIQTESENQELAASHLSTSTKSEKKAIKTHLHQDGCIKTIHMSESELEFLGLRAQTYIRLLLPDHEYIKMGFDGGVKDDWPPYDIVGFVIVTKEDNKWRPEFEHQAKVPEGTLLLRPQVTMSILVALIVCQSPDKMLMPCHVYEAIQQRFPYFLYMPTQQQTLWKKGVRHALTDKKWFSKVKFVGHYLGRMGSYWTFNYNRTMPENWNLSAQSLRVAVKPCLSGSSREASSLPGKTIMRDLPSNTHLNEQTLNSCNVLTNSAMTLLQQSCNTNIGVNNTNAIAEEDLTTDYQIWNNYSESSEPNLMLFTETCFETYDYNATKDGSLEIQVPNTNPKLEDEIVSRPDMLSTDVWEVYLAPAILCELPFESSANLTEI